MSSGIFRSVLRYKLVKFYQTTLHNIPEQNHFHTLYILFTYIRSNAYFIEMPKQTDTCFRCGCITLMELKGHIK